MSEDMKTIKSDIKEIKEMLTSNLVSQQDFAEYKTMIRMELTELNKRHNFRVLSTVIVTVIITSLTAYFFAGITQK